MSLPASGKKPMLVEKSTAIRHGRLLFNQNGTPLLMPWTGGFKSTEQRRERRAGVFFRRDSLSFNGYGGEVAGLYGGMDLRELS
jgi:hypothetical protein